MSRSWIKMYPEETFEGSTFVELTYKERYVWWGLLLMAGRSSEDGKVLKRWDTGFKPQELAYELDCPLSVVKSALERMTIKRRDEENPKIRILDNGIIEICNWHKYQSEYLRQKPYRQSNQSNSKSYKSISNLINNESNTLDIDIDKDIEKEKETYKEKENRVSKNLSNWKKNYAKGMELERKNEKLKLADKQERILLDKTKSCYKDIYDLNETCKQDKPICDICLKNNAVWKIEFDNAISNPQTYAQCENYIKHSCYYKDQGIEKYKFCIDCAMDSNWGNEQYHFGNLIRKDK